MKIDRVPLKPHYHPMGKPFTWMDWHSFFLSLTRTLTNDENRKENHAPKKLTDQDFVLIRSCAHLLFFLWELLLCIWHISWGQRKHFSPILMFNLYKRRKLICHENVSTRFYTYCLHQTVLKCITVTSNFNIIDLNSEFRIVSYQQQLSAGSVHYNQLLFKLVPTWPNTIWFCINTLYVYGH